MKIKLRALTFITAFLFLGEFGANAQQMFQVAIPGIATSSSEGPKVLQTADGGYALMGSTNLPGTLDVSLVKTDASGNVLWGKAYGGSGNEWGKNFRQTADKGYIIIGFTQTAAFNTGNNTVGEAYMVKTDSNGTVQWSKTYGTSAYDMAYDVIETTTGDFAFTGITNGFTSTGGIWIVKTNSSGVMQWGKCIGTNSVGSGGGHSITEAPNGDYVASGYISGQNVYVARVTPSGTLVWRSSFDEGSSSDQGDLIVPATGGGFIIGGMSGGIGSFDMLLVKIRDDGTHEWSKVIGTTGTDRNYSVMQSSGGAILINGHTENWGGPGINDNFLIKTDSDGVLTWARTYGTASDERGDGLFETADGGYVMTASQGSALYLVKTNASGVSGCNEVVRTGQTTVMTPTTTTSTAGTLRVADPTEGNPATVTTVISPVTTILCSSNGNIPPVASFQSSDTVFCANTCIDFTDLSTNATSWYWDFPGGTPSSSSDQNPQVCYLTGGTYPVTLIASNSGGSDTLEINNLLTVHPAPPTPLITQSNDTLYCSFDASYTSYQWYYDSTLVTGATNAFFVADQNGNYNVSVKNEFGCTESAGVNIIINGVNPYSYSELNIYPNPVEQELSLPLDGSLAKRTVIIYNVLGAKIYSLDFEVASHVNGTKSGMIIDVSALLPGMYFLQVRDENGIRTGTFIKRQR